MRPSEKKQLAILEYLANPSTNETEQLHSITSALSNQFSAEEINQELKEMDLKHQNLLQITVQPTIGGGAIFSLNSKHRFLTSKGDDRLYDLKHPNQEQPLNTSYNFNGPISSSGNQTFGNVEKQDVQNKTDNSQIWNTDNSIHQLLKVKNQLTDPSDQETLKELATLLKQVLDSNQEPKPSFLAKFSTFINKTWKTTSPVIAPILVELAKRTFINQ